ncbi:hypothetical protein TRAPUB_9090 [Trametes pubescens]|uniref:Uncharacterized protein n=1 Tax=Trametes pubescens TaxID=154538 RepID=A0A1M2W3B7_TRAPU|nr:hypothetical protein TRAPUB_9090 [Trametes pubescens]
MAVSSGSPASTTTRGSAASASTAFPHPLCSESGVSSRTEMGDAGDDGVGE